MSAFFYGGNSQPLFALLAPELLKPLAVAFADAVAVLDQAGGVHAAARKSM